ncbi:Protein NPGR1 [Linum perenne]
MAACTNADISFPFLGSGFSLFGDTMLCACSGEQFKFEEAPPSPVSLATRDFSVSGLSSRTTGEWDSKLEDIQVDEAESTLKEALSLNYEEARALLGRLEYQKGNFDAALQVFQGIDIRGLKAKMIRAIIGRSQPPRKPRSSKGEISPPTTLMSMHSVTLLLEALFLKAKSLEELGLFTEAAKECKVILDIVEAAFPNGMLQGIPRHNKLEEMSHKALELLPVVWTKAGRLDDAIASYRRALLKSWNLDPWRLAKVQMDLASMLLYGAVEAKLPPYMQLFGQATPKTNTEEAILLLLVLMSKVASGEIKWDKEIMDHLTYALTITGQFELLAEHVEQALPGVYSRAERWYLLALCYNAAGQDETALNLLKKVSGPSESNHKPHIASFLLGAKLCSQNRNHCRDGINFAQRVLDQADSEHFKPQARKFLGICSGGAARTSMSDIERNLLQKKALGYLNQAACSWKEDPEVLYSLGLGNSMQRNLDAAFQNAMMYAEVTPGNSVKGCKLLAHIISSEQRFKDAETVVEFALDEAGRMDQLELLRLKAVLRVAQGQPKQAIETYRLLLSLVQAQRDLQAKSPAQALAERNLELAAWQDLAGIYIKLKLWPDAKICVDKTMLMEFFSPRGWHTTGTSLEAQELYREALISFSMSLSIEPDYVPSLVSTAAVLMKLGGESIPIARSFLMNALRLDPTNHEAWMNLGLISKQQGSLKQAADCFQAAYELKLSAPVESFILDDQVK